MKRILCLCLALCFLCGCARQPTAENTQIEKEYSFGMWVSCYELENLSKNGFSSGFESLAKSAKDLGINTLYVHTRAFESCIYNSKIFPKEDWCKKENFDVLSFMTDVCKKYNLQLHAWINPYRLSHKNDAVLSENLGHLKENEDFSRVENGVYLVPTSLNAQALIINGVKELISNYDIDGIHFDDYFYPTTNIAFDSVSYENYLKNSKKPISLDNFRRSGVNAMISATKQAINACKKDIVFSVSPAADINKNYSELYADVEYWCKEELIDVIIPQIYFGFNYPLEKYCFENLVVDWIKCTNKTKVLLYIGLAPYKLGANEGPDKDEWQSGFGVVANQLKNVFAKAEIGGISLYSYSALNNKQELFSLQRENIKQQILEKREN